jgi:WXXGXW repeat (2 copies)
MMVKMTTQRFKIATFASFGLVASAVSLAVQDPSILIQDPVIVAQQEIQQPATPATDAQLPAPVEQEEIDLLMRAPLHEAFAEVPQTTPTPNPIVARKPPKDVEELPPEYKPEGENVVWIPGYWAWDEERNDFIWISGVWRDTPPGQRWVPGYWNEEANGFRWVTGFWNAAETQELTYLPQPPAPLEIGPTMQAPSEDYYYAPGCWVYNDARYVWRPGYYAPYVEDIVWVPPTYIWTPSGYVFRPGYYDRPFDQRGTVFAPVYFNQPIYQQPDYYFQPTCVINTGFGLLPHLFLRSNRNFYYFGDWYADRYIGNDFCAWSSVGNFGFYRNHYDPLYSYYSSPFIRYQNVSLVGWARNQHVHCLQNAGFRPPLTFNINIINQRFNNNNVHIHDRDFDHVPHNQVFLANTLEREVRQGANRHDGRNAKNFVKLDEQNRKQEKEIINLERNLARERRDLERQVTKNGGLNPQAGGVSAQPRKVTLPKEVRNAQNDVERAQHEAEQLAKRQETAMKIQQKQQEAAQRAQARRATSDQRKLANQLEDQVRDAQKNQRQNGQVQKGGVVNNGNNGQPNNGQVIDRQVQRKEETAQKRLETQQAAQARDAQRAVERQREEQERSMKKQGLQGRAVQQNQQQEIERATRKQQDQMKDQMRQQQLQQQQQQQQQAEAQRAAQKQQNLQMQQRRAADQAARQATDLQRNAERQRADQERAQRSAAQSQQRDMERAQRDSQRRQNDNGNNNGNGRKKKN